MEAMNHRVIDENHRVTTTVEKDIEVGSGVDLDGLDAIFRPKSVAVLGVTNTPETVPHDIFVNLLSARFPGGVYPVAPRKKHIAGVRAYDYVVDIPDPVDLAILVFPGGVCEKALTQCAEKGIRAAIIISAGFREIGASGLARENRIKAIASEHGIRLIGPNCLGVINTEPNVLLNASFARRARSMTCCSASNTSDWLKSGR